MPGKICPQCGKATLFESPTGRKCTKCGFSVYLPPNEGKGGLGRKCSICGKMSVFNGKCTKCGAKQI